MTARIVPASSWRLRSPRSPSVGQARLPDLVDRVVRRILAEIEFYRDREVVSLQDLRDSVASNLESMVAQLTSDQPPDLSSPRVTGRRAEQGTPLATSCTPTGSASPSSGRRSSRESRRSMRAPPDTLVDAASGVWWLIGEYTQELTVAYREAAAELLLAGARERSALVEALFTGGTPDRDTLWEAAKLLRLPWEGCSWWWPPRRPGWPRKACQTSRHCWPGVGSGRPGAAPRPPDRRGVAAPRRRPPRRPRAGGGARRAGVSPIYHSLGDTPRALHYARLVLGSLPAGAPAVAQFEQTPLRVLAAAAPDAAGELVRTVLGPILELPTQDRSSLLSTLQAWFDAGGSAVETGKRIYCHPNTVRYRLRRLQEHTGRSLDDPKAVAELLAALDALRLVHGTSWLGESCAAPRGRCGANNSRG